MMINSKSKNNFTGHLRHHCFKNIRWVPSVLEFYWFLKLAQPITISVSLQALSHISSTLFSSYCGKNEMTELFFSLAVQYNFFPSLNTWNESGRGGCIPSTHKCLRHLLTQGWCSLYKAFLQKTFYFLSLITCRFSSD